MSCLPGFGFQGSSYGEGYERENYSSSCNCPTSTTVICDSRTVGFPHKHMTEKNDDCVGHVGAVQLLFLYLLPHVEGTNYFNLPRGTEQAVLLSSCSTTQSSKVCHVWQGGRGCASPVE